MRNKRLRKRFGMIIMVYLITVYLLWILYQNTIFSYVKENTTETTALIGSNLAEDIGEEFSRMKLATSTIAGSVYVQDFLAETDMTGYYEKAVAVSEIIRKTTYPYLGEDSVITITESGGCYRFTGSISNDAIEYLRLEIAERADHTGDYLVMELDGTDYFCMMNPVFSRDSMMESPVGYVVTLSNMARMRRMLSTPKIGSGGGYDTAVILNDVILFSSDSGLDGRSAGELDELYGLVTVSGVAGSRLTVAAAITGDALYYGERLFFTVSAVTLVVLLITVIVLYRVLSSQVVNPTIQEADSMRMGLLTTQIDAHFLVNTIACIKGLAAQGQTDKIEIAAGNLADLLKSRHESDAEINVFDQMEDIERYIEIMNIRYGDKYLVTLSVDDDLLHYCMLGQVLQPLVENALLHGLGNKESDCRLIVNGKLEKDAILFEVTDNGDGMEEERLDALQKALESADDGDDGVYRLKGVALVNIQRRLRTRYGERYGVTVRNSPEAGLTAAVRVPLLKE